jgi:hypothetical protein
MTNTDLADAMNALTLIEHGLEPAMAARVVKQWHAKCLEASDAAILIETLLTKCEIP